MYFLLNSKLNPHFCSMNELKRMIPNLFTAGNLVGGILAIIFSLTGKIHLAPYCIFASAIFDFLDGFMARLLKVPSEMGKQLDSLADMVTFGVAPGIIVYELFRIRFMSILFEGEMSRPFLDIFPINSTHMDTGIWQHPEVSGAWELAYLPYFGLIIPVFALFRLAKFNLDSRQTDSFIGLPTPAMTLFFAALPLLILSHDARNSDFYFGIVANIILNPYFLSISVLVMSILMVVELPLFALKFKHFRWKGNEIRFIFLTLSAVLLATLFFWAIPLIIILYVLLSIINNQFVKAKTNEI